MGTKQKKRYMKKILLSLLVLSSAVFFSCNSGGDDPKAVLSQFFDAMSKKDVAAARKLTTAESKSMLDMMEMGMKMSPSEAKADEKYDKSKMEFGEPKIEGDKATIAVKEKSSGEAMNFTLKKEGGSWKVAFDKNSMMNMGMEKMKEGGINASDSIGKAMDELKNLNMDSLKQGMEEGMKSLDSATNELKKLENK